MARKRFAVAPTGAASRFTNKALETLSGARTITPAEVELYNALNFDPGGAGRTVTLPPEESSAGVFLMICNEADAAEILTINNDAAAAIVTPTQNEAAILWCDGVNWYGLVGSTS